MKPMVHLFAHSPLPRPVEKSSSRWPWTWLLRTHLQFVKWRGWSGEGHSRQWEQHMHLPIHSFIHPLSFPPSIYLSTYSPTCPPGHPPTCLPMYLSIHLAFDTIIINRVIQIPSGSPSLGWVLESSRHEKTLIPNPTPDSDLFGQGWDLAFGVGVFLVCVFFKVF